MDFSACERDYTSLPDLQDRTCQGYLEQSEERPMGHCDSFHAAQLGNCKSPRRRGLKKLSEFGKSSMKMCKLGSISRFSRALAASIWGHCSQIIVFTRIWRTHTKKGVRMTLFMLFFQPPRHLSIEENTTWQIDPVLPPHNSSLQVYRNSHSTSFTMLCSAPRMTGWRSHCF